MAFAFLIPICPLVNLIVADVAFAKRKTIMTVVSKPLLGYIYITLPFCIIVAVLLLFQGVISEQILNNVLIN